MRVFETKLTDIKPYDRNAKIHPIEQVKNVAESIKQFGFVQPIVIDKNGEIIIGHCRFEAAKYLELETVPCVRADELTDEQVKALRIVDNKTNESPWDFELLQTELDEISLEGFELDFMQNDFGFAGLSETEEAEDEYYTTKILTPIYEPVGDCPDISELVNLEKTNKLILSLQENDNLPTELKDFLTASAYRHADFNFKKIANFYAHQSKEVQDEFKKHALVIVDFGSAIENGFVEWDKRMRELIGEDYEQE